MGFDNFLKSGKGANLMRVMQKGVSICLMVFLLAAALTACGASGGGAGQGAGQAQTGGGNAGGAGTGGGGGGAGAAGSPTSATPESGDIVIGVLSPTSGSEAYYGNDMLKSYQLAVDEINSAGGILGRQVSLYAADDG